jgi:hypothetical protein
VLVALQRAWATYILKCDIIVGESFFGLRVFLGFPFLSLFICFLQVVGALEHDLF